MIRIKAKLWPSIPVINSLLLVLARHWPCLNDAACEVQLFHKQAKRTSKAALPGHDV